MEKAFIIERFEGLYLPSIGQEQVLVTDYGEGAEPIATVYIDSYGKGFVFDEYEMRMVDFDTPEEMERYIFNKYLRNFENDTSYPFKYMQRVSYLR